jgi:hypothetical protein
VADKLDNKLSFVFVLVTDMTMPENMKVGDDEIIVTAENMESLYGPWLARRRKFALFRSLSPQANETAGPSANNSGPGKKTTAQQVTCRLRLAMCLRMTD